jgi:hypothetical protein
MNVSAVPMAGGHHEYDGSGHAARGDVKPV